MPFVPFMLGALVLGFATWFILDKAAKARVVVTTGTGAKPANAPRASLGDLLDLDDIHVEFAPDLVEMVLDAGTGLDARIANMRNHVATNFGVLLPEIRLTDNATLPPGTYVVRIQGVEQVRDRLRPGQVLALLSTQVGDLAGEDVKEPVYGAPARWISPDAQDKAAMAGLTTVWPAEVLATHLLEVIKRNFPRLLTLKALRRLLDELVNLTDRSRSDANRKMLDELMPDKVPVDVLLSVLRLLLEERVSIRNLPLILESVAEGRQVYTSAEGIAEHVRQRLGFQLVAEMRRADGTIPLVQLAPEWEDIFTTYQITSDRGGADVALPPEDFNRLATAIADRLARASDNGTYPAVVTSMRRRRFLRTVLAAKGIPNPVLSFEEIGINARPALVGFVAA
jgi:flagellar biosynthesis protein FlhA